MRKLVTFVATGLLLLSLGCSQQTSSPVATVDASDSAEMPAELRRLVDIYTNTEDGNLEESWTGTGEIAPSLSDTSYDVYAVGFIWGPFLPALAPPPGPTDWTGGLGVNTAAAIRVAHVIDFEPGQDSIFYDSTTHYPHWISVTQNGLDGVVTLVFVKRGVISVAAPRLTFRTLPITLDFTFDQLVDLNAIYRVDDHNAVGVVARKLRPDRCPRGHLVGLWVKESMSGEQGHIQGLWLDRNRHPMGIVSGEFWTDSLGHGWLDGVVSGLVTTEVIAELKGSWFYDDVRLCPLCGTGHGQFEGEFVYLDDGATGKFKGEFGDYALDPAELRMPFFGVWRLDCPNDASDHISVTD